MLTSIVITVYGVSSRTILKYVVHSIIESKYENVSCCTLQGLLAEFNRFKIEDVPPRLEARQKLLRLFEEIQVGIFNYPSINK